MRVITSGIAVTGTTNMVISIFDEKGGVLPISNANRIVVVTALQVSNSANYVFDFDFSSGKCQAIQPAISIGDVATTLIRVIVYYDVIE